MAIIKNVDTEIGVGVSYWRIVRVDLDVLTRTVWFSMAGYVSKEAREEGKQPAAQVPYTMYLDEDVVPEQIGRTEMYDFAKAQVAFVGAEDDV